MNKTDITITIEQRILLAASTIFTVKGYEAASMNEIANEAGVARTALNYYYRTKSLLFESVIVNYADKLWPNIADVAQLELSIFDKIPRIVKAYILFLQENPHMPLFVINELKRDREQFLSALFKDTSRVEPLMQLHKQLLNEMEIGNIRRLQLIDIVSTFVGLLVMPFAIKDALEALFINSKESSFNNFLERRESQVSEILIKFLQP